MMDLIDSIRQPIAVEFAAYERAFASAIHTDNAVLKDALAHIFSQSGKQLRPTLVLLAAKACHGIGEKTIQTAIALELLHTASLIHDDVVDSSDMRRGQASVNQKWNNKVAVLVGDFMLSRVVELLADIRNNKIVGIVAEMGKHLAEGELLQLHPDKEMWINEKTYFKIIEKKTAQLCAACTQAGAVSSGATSKMETSLRNYGKEFGICFQLKDDVLDYADCEEIGKPTMGDIRDGKVTLPLLKTMERATKDEKSELRQIAVCPLSDENEQRIKNFVIRYDGIGYAYRCMAEHQERAKEELRRTFHEDAAIRSLTMLVDYAVNRMK